MEIKYKVMKDTVISEYQYYNDIFGDDKEFPVLTIGTDSYVGG